MCPVCGHGKNVQMVMIRALIDGLDNGSVTHAEFVKWIDQILHPGDTFSVVIPDLLKSIQTYSQAISEIYAKHYDPIHPNSIEPKWRDAITEVSVFIMKYTGRLREMLIYYGG